jgi:predicted lactoylglutathione lyase
MIARNRRLNVERSAKPASSTILGTGRVCLAALSRENVDAFHAAALRMGGADNGRPGLWADYGSGYQAAFVIDPDGYRIEAHHDG